MRGRWRQPQHPEEVSRCARSCGDYRDSLEDEPPRLRKEVCVFVYFVWADPVHPGRKLQTLWSIRAHQAESNLRYCLREALNLLLPTREGSSTLPSRLINGHVVYTSYKFEYKMRQSVLQQQ